MWPIKFEKKTLQRVLTITTICGILFSLDYWTFGKAIPELADEFEDMVTFNSWISAVFYGGIIEEVLMRLLFMTLIAFVIWKLFLRKYAVSEIPVWIFVVANIIAASAFAAGHIPATINMFGELSPIILFRCFLLNGGLGLVFGRLYRKYGIQYAMVGHAGCHIISKIIWMIFI